MMEEISEKKFDNGKLIKIISGNISEEKVDIIVNSANPKLTNKESVGLSLIEKGGEILQKECDLYIENNGDLNEGDIFITKGYNLSCKWV
jgi:O-acetyl-ADP-ribose deacetylase (regulator of RNase III)